MKGGYQELIHRKRNAHRQASESAERLTGWATYLTKNAGTIVRELIEDKLFPTNSLAARIFGWVFPRARQRGYFRTNIHRVGRSNKSRLNAPYYEDLSKEISSSWTSQIISLAKPLIATALMAYVKHKVSNVFSFRKKKSR